MKGLNIFVILTGLLAVLPQHLFAQGIPEPGLLMYGSIGGMVSNLPPAGPVVNWAISNSTESISVRAKLITVNDQVFYTVLVPFETRSIGGSQPFPATPNTLELKREQTTYSRAVTINGKIARILPLEDGGNPGIFSFGPSDRGKIKRIDIENSNTTESFSEWLERYGLPVETNPDADPLGKGMTYQEQFIAGTDPTNRDSIFKFIDIRPEISGLTLIWASAPGREYFVERSSDLGKSFNVLQDHIAWTSPTNTFLDATSTGSGPYFYRIGVRSIAAPQ